MSDLPQRLLTLGDADVHYWLNTISRGVGQRRRFILTRHDRVTKHRQSVRLTQAQAELLQERTLAARVMAELLFTEAADRGRERKPGDWR